MKYDPFKHHRHSIRLQGYDYSQAGAYFVTVCALNRECLFGEIVDEEMELSEFGRVVQSCWDDLPRHYANAELDEFVIMPNHVHGIIVLRAGIDDDADPVRAGLRPAPTTTRRSLFEIVRAFKSFSARRINELRDTQGTPVWQRNYFEHIIRNEDELNRIRKYIIENPSRWAADEENPLNARNNVIK